MADTTLVDFLNQYAYTASDAVRVELDERQIAILGEVDNRIAALTGADSAITAFIDQVKLLTDAVPGTPEFDQGQNLYTLIAEKYALVNSSVSTISGIVDGLVTQVTGIAQDLAALALRVTNMETRTASLEVGFGALNVSFSGELANLSNGMSAVVGNFRAGLKGLASPSGTTVFTAPGTGSGGAL